MEVTKRDLTLRKIWRGNSGAQAEISEDPSCRGCGRQRRPGSTRLGSWTHDPRWRGVFTVSETHRIKLGPLQLDTGRNGDMGLEDGRCAKSVRINGKLVLWKRLWVGSQKTRGSVFSLRLRAGGSGATRSNTTRPQNGNNTDLCGTEMDTTCQRVLD